MSLKRKIFTIIFTAMIIPSSLFALEVDVDEVKQAKKVEFINYEGKTRRFDSLREIKSIGYGLSRGAKSAKDNSLFKLNIKYSVIRINSNDGTDRLNADIIFINKAARIDHIRNVRRIISAYLENTYKYNTEEAVALSLYLTYYNAVYRGDLKYFGDKYKKAVLKRVNSRIAGISTKYYEWPGKTAIIIPLTRESKRSKINAFLISDKKTRKEVSKNGGNKNEKKTLRKMKENEVKKNKEEVSKKKENLARKKEELEKKKEKLQNEKKDVSTKKEDLKNEKKEISKIKDPAKRAEKKKEIEKKEQEIKKQEKNLEKKEKEVKKEETEIKKTEKNISKNEKEIKDQEKQITEEKKEDKKSENSNSQKTDKELTQKKKELEQKEKELDKREDELKKKNTDKNVFASKLYYLRVKDYLEGGHYNNEMFMINAKTRKIEFKSPVTNICGRKYDVNSRGIVVITHRGNHIAGHRLTLIERKTLTAIKTGEDDIFWRSFVRIDDDSIYTIVKKDNNYYLAKFDFDLNLKSLSEEKVHENTFITFFEDFIYINRYDKKVMVLKKEDLKLIDIVKE